MSVIKIPFGPWLPDLPATENPGMETAEGCYPAGNGYQPHWLPETTSLSVTGTVLGAERFERSDGTEVIVVGTSSDLFVIVGGAVNASSLALTVSTDEHWSFEQFDEALYATVKSGGSFYLTDIDSDTTFSASPGTPPKGNALARVDDFLIYGDLTDIDSSDAPFRIRWSGFNNPNGNYVTDLATQSSFDDMPSHLGPVTGISGGQVGMIFQKFGVSRIDYTGGTVPFQRVVISENIGCVSGASIVYVEGRWYWLSRAGFAVSDGTSAQLISGARIWDWFLENANTDELGKVQAAINHDRRCIVWNFCSVDQTTYDRHLVYNWEIDQFSYIKPMNAAGNAYTANDWLVPCVYTGAHSAGEPRRRNILGCFIGGTYHQLSGGSVDAVFVTAEFESEPGRRTYVSEVRPMLEQATFDPTITLLYRDNELQDTQTVAASVGAKDAGYHGVSLDARYIAVKMACPSNAAWHNAFAVQVRAIPTGFS